MEQTATFRDFLKVIFRQKAVVLTSFFTVVIVVGIGLLFQTPVYEGKVKMMVSAEKQVESPYYRELIGSRNIEVTLSQSEIVNSNPVIERAVRAVGLFERPLDYEVNFSSPLKRPFIKWQAKLWQKKLSKVPEEQRRGILFRLAVEDLKRHIKVEPIRDTNLFTITVRDYSPVGAAILANVVSRSYVIFDLQQQLAEMQLKYGEKHPTSIQLQDNIAGMIKNLNGQPLPDVEAIGPASVKIVEQASYPLRPAGIPKPLTFILGVLMAIFLAVMLAFLFEYLDQSFKSPSEVESVLGIPYLGAVPKKAKIEAFHNLADQLFLVMRDKKIKALQFTSALPEEGVTNIIANVATYLAKTAGHKTLVIDANLRNPAMSKNFRIPESGGLSEILEGKINFEKAVKEVAQNLQVITAGKSLLNPVTLLDSSMMQEVIKWAKEHYQIVLVDSPNLKETKDAQILAGLTDGCCLVITEAKTRRQVVQASLAPLVAKNVQIIGVILNNRSFVLPQFIYDMV